MDLLVTMDFDKRGRPVMRDSELVKAARAGKPVILDNVDWLPLFTRLVLRKIVNAANAGRDSMTINGRYILFKSGFKAESTRWPPEPRVRTISSSRARAVS